MHSRSVPSSRATSLQQQRGQFVLSHYCPDKWALQSCSYSVQVSLAVYPHFTPGRKRWKRSDTHLRKTRLPKRKSPREKNNSEAFAETLKTQKGHSIRPHFFLASNNWCGQRMLMCRRHCVLRGSSLLLSVAGTRRFLTAAPTGEEALKTTCENRTDSESPGGPRQKKIKAEQPQPTKNQQWASLRTTDALAQETFDK
ncbi:hypothetical protein EC9_28910 [Rosistilla ulvae]|uniref:Uncharacterized protein n=1 Tax=Rosistilla ulvae TaxID=1930277 RepID=A0A517M1K3_9BACT|nr:hypothetical protein EC9_28910 [Rosistilla ulvae]